MQIILTAVEEPLANAWEEYCGDLPDVIIHRGSILDVPCDAVVSPANSFGFMDGGIDMLYMHYFQYNSRPHLSPARKLAQRRRRAQNALRRTPQTPFVGATRRVARVETAAV